MTPLPVVSGYRERAGASRVLKSISFSLGTTCLVPGAAYAYVCFYFEEGCWDTCCSNHFLPFCRKLGQESARSRLAMLQATEVLHDTLAHKISTRFFSVPHFSTCTHLSRETPGKVSLSRWSYSCRGSMAEVGSWEAPHQTSASHSQWDNCHNRSELFRAIQQRFLGFGPSNRWCHLCDDFQLHPLQVNSICVILGLWKMEGQSVYRWVSGLNGAAQNILNPRTWDTASDDKTKNITFMPKRVVKLKSWWCTHLNPALERQRCNLGLFLPGICLILEYFVVNLDFCLLNNMPTTLGIICTYELFCPATLFPKIMTLALSLLWVIA